MNNLPAPPALEINGIYINKVHSAKSPGIIIVENLTWVNHIDTLSKKIAAGIGALKRIRDCVPPATLHSIYRGVVQSHFDYFIVVWDSCGKTLSDKLKRLQNRASRVTYSSYDADTNELMKILGWKDLETQRQITKLKWFINL